MVKCQIDKCINEAIKNESFCRTHYIEKQEEIYLDNTDETNPGIIQWLSYMYPEHYRDPFSKEHIQVYLALLELYDPRFLNKRQRYRELIAFRGFAKTKTIFGFFSYILAHNGMTMKIKSSDGEVHNVVIFERTMVILSETGGMAEEFVVNIRDEFSINERLKYFYKFTIIGAREDDTGQWTRRAFKINNCFVMGFGALQHIRGKIKGAYRPTFVAFDDIYSENSTLTPESRKKTKTWFQNAVLNTIDTKIGKAFLVGTIVHEDTVLVEAERSGTWETLKFVPMPLNKLKEFISRYLVVDYDRRLCKLPHEDIPEKFVRIRKQAEYFKEIQNKEEWGLIWPAQVGLYELALQYKEAVEDSNIAGFYQEYFHITIPEELKRFRPEYFQKIPGQWYITNEFGYNWFHCSEMYKEPKIINIEIGVDQSSGNDESDDVSIMVAGALPDGKYVMLEVSYGKYSMRDVIREDSPDYMRIDRVLTSKEQITKIGYIDETFRLTLKYKPKVVKVGTGGGLEPTALREMDRVFKRNRLYLPVIPRVQTKQSGKQVVRIKDTLLPKYETMSVYHASSLETLEFQLEFLGKTKHDDVADSAEVAIFNIQRPQDVPYKLFTEPAPMKKPKWGYPDNEEGGWLKNWRN